MNIAFLVLGAWIFIGYGILIFLSATKPQYQHLAFFSLLQIVLISTLMRGFFLLYQNTDLALFWFQLSFLLFCTSLFSLLFLKRTSFRTMLFATGSFFLLHLFFPLDISIAILKFPSGDFLEMIPGSFFPFSLVLFFFVLLSLLLHFFSRKYRGLLFKKHILLVFSFFLFTLFSGISFFSPFLKEFSSLFFLFSPISGIFFLLPLFFSISQYRFLETSSRWSRILHTFFLLSITFFVSFSLSFVAFSYFSSLKLSDALVLTSLFTLCTAFFFQKFWFHFSLTSPLHIALESFLKESVLLSSFDDLQRKIDEIFGVRLGYARHQLVLVEEMTMSSYLEPLSSRIEHILEKIPETCFSETDVFVFPFLDSEEKEVLSHFFTRLHIEYLSLLLVDEKIVGIFGFTPSLSFSVAEKKSIELFSQRLSVLLFSLSLQEKQADTMKILQSVIDEKTEKLQEHIEQQNTLYNEQNNFLALTAHEFRTPLSIALFQVQDILSQEGVPNNLKEDLSLIEESLENLKTLTQNLFDVQKFDLETTEIVFTPLPLSSVLSDIFSAFSSAVKEKNITIVKEQDEDLFRFSVFGESSYIMQAVLNVFGNALKFSPKNSQMKVGAKKDGDFLVLEIHDSGPGISEENQKILFNKFQKGNTKKSGMGLGLYIAKKVCEKHGGGISVASSSSLSGAVFTLSFPIVPVKNVENSEETY